MNKELVIAACKTGAKVVKQNAPKIIAVVSGAYGAYADWKFKQKVDILEKTVSELQKK